MKNITKYLAIFLLALTTQMTTNAIWVGTAKQLKELLQEYEEQLEKVKEEVRKSLEISDKDYDEFYEQNLKQSKKEERLYTQLGEAAQKGDLAFLTHLIQKQGASVNRVFYIGRYDLTQPTNQPTRWGVSLLHIAVMQNKLNVAECLVKNGIIINLHDELFGKTALEYCEDEYMKKYLEKALREHLNGLIELEIPEEILNSKESTEWFKYNFDTFKIDSDKETRQRSGQTNSAFFIFKALNFQTLDEANDALQQSYIQNDLTPIDPNKIIINGMPISYFFEEVQKNELACEWLRTKSSKNKE